MVDNNTDGDDTSAAISPAATEVCNEVDDCEGTRTLYWEDADTGGYGARGSASTAACSAPSGWVANSGVCDDGDATVSPADNEVCNDLDDDCDGAVDESLQPHPTWADADGDGYGVQGDPVLHCVGLGWAPETEDCDDTDRSRTPANPSIATRSTTTATATWTRTR